MHTITFQNHNKKLPHVCIHFFRSMRVDLYRSIFTPSFLLTILLFLFWLFFNGIFDVILNRTIYILGIPYVLNQALTGYYGLGMLTLVISAVPYATSYLTDIRCGFSRYAIKRIGLHTYALSRIISVAASAFLAFCIAGNIFLIGLCMTGAQHTVPGEGKYLSGDYLDIVTQFGPIQYYFVRFTISGLTCSMAAVFSLFISALIPNLYVVLLSPLVAYYCYSAIFSFLSLLDGATGLVHLFVLDYIIISQVSQNNLFSFVWAVVYQLTLIVLCAKGFLHLLEKEHNI